ncbi:lantibiotic immunity ABC transporter MutE/EpiE family permease subunit [Clostridium sardiniense]
MFKIIQAENLKYKRTFLRKIVIIIPLLIAIYASITLIDFNNDYNYFPQNSINWWTLIFMPVSIALLTVLSSSIEKKSGNYRALKSKNISKLKMWISKNIVIGFYTLIMTIIAIFISIILYYIKKELIGNLFDIIIAYFTVWLTTLAIIPISLFLSELFGTFITILSSFIGILGTMFLSTESSWILWPWSWSIRLMCPIMKTNPNGTLLEIGDPLLDSSVIGVGILTSIIICVGLIFLTGIWFSRRETV